MKKLLLLLLVPIGALVWWGYHVKNEPPQVPFAKVRRETLVSTLPTNGKVEPIEWSPVRSQAAGLVAQTHVREGQTVAKGTLLVTLHDPALASEIASAEARVAQSRAELSMLEAGGKGAELTEIENSLAKARFDRDVAQREYASLRRLAEKQAATAAEVNAARGKLQEAELQIQSLERRRSTLVGKADVAAATARLHEAGAALAGARARQRETAIHAPQAGIVYGLAVRPGAYVDAGDLVANVGRIDTLRVRVYVDEPEVGRVAIGQPVTITWDALPGRNWEGRVERMPSEIQALGTRQVGEVLCTIANPGLDLIPGTNVNAEIRTVVVPGALSIPKEALRRQGTAVGVFVLGEGDRLAWRNVGTGASSITRVQILNGLADGDPVALPTELLLKAGLSVSPVYP